MGINVRRTFTLGKDLTPSVAIVRSKVTRGIAHLDV
jgi:hypothetical protein